MTESTPKPNALLRKEAADVAVAWGPTRYDVAAPYSPSVQYPEYPFDANASGPANEVYDAVRESLRLLGLDAQHFGQSGWNPLRSAIR